MQYRLFKSRNYYNKQYKRNGINKTLIPIFALSKFKTCLQTQIITLKM